MDEAGNPTGSVFATETVSDLGDFDLEVEYQGPVRLEGDGFYYNEATGSLSDAQITLRAFDEVAEDGDQEIYLNLVTHLTNRRVRHLFADGASLSDAIEQAEEELQAVVGVGGEDFSPERSGTDMQVVGEDDPENAYLLALSAILAKAAEVRNPDSADAELQEMINTFAQDFESDGEVAEARVEPIDEAHRGIDADWITHLLEQRLDDIDSSAEIPDMGRVLDTSGDGFANADDVCPRDHGPSQGEVDEPFLCDYERRFFPIDSGFHLLLLDDITGDGKTDIILDVAGGLRLIADINGDNFQLEDLAIEGRENFHIADAVDVDGDGIPDLVGLDFSVQEGPEEEVAWFRQTEPGEFERMDPIWPNNLTGDEDCAFSHRDRLSWADLDGSGRADLVVASRDCVVELFQNESGELGSPRVIREQSDIFIDSPPVAVDVTDNGFKDIVFAHPGGSPSSPKIQVTAILKDDSGDVDSVHEHEIERDYFDFVEFLDVSARRAGSSAAVLVNIQEPGGGLQSASFLLELTPEEGFEPSGSDITIEFLDDFRDGVSRGTVLADIFGEGAVAVSPPAIFGFGHSDSRGDISRIRGVRETLLSPAPRDDGEECIVSEYEGRGERGLATICPR